MPVLEDGPGDCSTGERAGAAGRRPATAPGTPRATASRSASATVSYRDYVRAITAHYRDDPTILGWTLVNEAETERARRRGPQRARRLRPRRRRRRARGRPAPPGHPRHPVQRRPRRQRRRLPRRLRAGRHGLHRGARLGLLRLRRRGHARSGTPDGELPDPTQCQAPDAADRLLLRAGPRARQADRRRRGRHRAPTAATERRRDAGPACSRPRSTPRSRPARRATWSGSSTAPTPTATASSSAPTTRSSACCAGTRAPESASDRPDRSGGSSRPVARAAAAWPGRRNLDGLRATFVAPP